MSDLLNPLEMTMTKKRSVSIRECDNGYIMNLSVDNPNGNTATERYMRKELVIMSLPQLLKKLKTFMESEIIDEE